MTGEAWGPTEKKKIGALSQTQERQGSWEGSSSCAHR